jgi:hypothetical protein
MAEFLGRDSRRKNERYCRLKPTKEKWNELGQERFTQLGNFNNFKNE